VPDAPVHPAIQRVLDAAARKGVTLEVVQFDESTHTAAEAAAALGTELGQIVKSLVFVIPAAGSPEPVLCLVAGHNRVDLTRLAAIISAPEIRRATAREARDLTGFSIGGIPPIGTERVVRVIMDPDLGRYPDGLGRSRSADRGLWRATGDASHPVERDGRPDRRGTDRIGRREPGDRGRGPALRRLIAPLLRRCQANHGTHLSPIRAGSAPAGDGAAAGRAREVFALSEAGGALVDLSTRVAADPDPLCRAELRLEGPRGAWSARFASLIHDEPRALHWDTAGLLVVAYGFHTYGLDVESGEARWDHRSATPLIALLGSPRLAHVIVQSELETFAIEPDGTVAWRIAHSDVVTAADLVGGRLVLTSFDGQVRALDPATGRSAA